MAKRDKWMDMWVSCPECRAKFGVALRWVVKYLDIVLAEMERKTKTMAKKLKS